MYQRSFIILLLFAILLMPESAMAKRTEEPKHEKRLLDLVIEKIPEGTSVLYEFSMMYSNGVMEKGKSEKEVYLCASMAWYYAVCLMMLASSQNNEHEFNIGVDQSQRIGVSFFGWDFEQSRVNYTKTKDIILARMREKIPGN